MPFSETQLTTWAGQGAITSSATTYNSIKTCIESVSWNSDIKYDMYLQGSYKNSTNIRANSDIDVVVEFQSVFYSNKESLKPEELKEFNDYYSDGKYSLDDFKAAILEALEKYYEKSNVKDGNKSIKVTGTNGRLNSDVICCAEYREYRSFKRTKTNDYDKGIVFWTKKYDKVVNFPIQHYDNGVTKNTQAGGNYKAATRIIKNMRSRMIDLNLIDNKLAPSYFIECLLYNVPSLKFQFPNYTQIIPEIIIFLKASVKDNSIEKFVCQNYQRYLFGSSDQQWDIEKCKTFISELNNFWNAG
jgi:hypothetical protein